MLSVAALPKTAIDIIAYYRGDDYYHDGENKERSQFMVTGNFAEHAGLKGNAPELEIIMKNFLQNRGGEIVSRGNEKVIFSVKAANTKSFRGWDLTFSAPKSVSVLWAMSDEPTRLRIQNIHNAAVREATKFLEERVAMTRRGAQGKELERVAGIIGIEYLHYTARAVKDSAPDPLLHTHYLVANMCLRYDGTVGTLVGRNFFTWKKALGAYYQAALSEGLQQELGVTVNSSKHGFSIEGVPLEVERYFSKRRLSIENVLLENKWTTTKAAQAATIYTRKTETVGDRRTFFSLWQADGTSMGFGPSEAKGITEKIPPESIQNNSVIVPNIKHGTKRLYGIEHDGAFIFTDKAKTVKQLKLSESYHGRLLYVDIPVKDSDLLVRQLDANISAKYGITDYYYISPQIMDNCRDFRTVLDMGTVISNLTRVNSTFKEEHVWEFVARQSVGRQGTEGIHHDVKLILSHPQVIVLQDNNVSMSKGRYGVAATLMTSQEMLDIEKSIIDYALKNNKGGKITNRTVDKVIEFAVQQTKIKLTPEQKHAIRFITTNDKNISCVVSEAKSGSGVVAYAAAQAYKNTGWNIMGVGMNARVARTFEESSGIKSESIYSLMEKLKTGAIKLDSSFVLFLDEAGFIGSRQMAELIHYSGGAKMVLIGDYRQIQPGVAGNVLSYLAKPTQAANLSESFSLNTSDDSAFKKVRLGGSTEIVQALDHFRKKDRLLIHDSRVEMYHNIIENYIPKYDEENNIIMCSTRAEAIEMNHAVRGRLKLGGMLKDPVIIDSTNGQIELAAGDKVVFTKNSRVLGIKVGDVGIVRHVGISKGRHVIRFSLGERGVIDVDINQYNYYRYGYATYPREAQVETYDMTHVMIGDRVDIETFYVQISRHKNDCVVHVDKGSINDFVDKLRPTKAMIDHAELTAKNKDVDLPDNYANSFLECRKFLNQYSEKKLQAEEYSEELLDLAKQINVSKIKKVASEFDVSDSVGWSEAGISRILSSDKTQPVLPPPEMVSYLRQVNHKDQWPLPAGYEDSFAKSQLTIARYLMARDKNDFFKEKYPVVRQILVRVAEENTSRAENMISIDKVSASECHQDAMLIARFVGANDRGYGFDNPFVKSSLKSKWKYVHGDMDVESSDVARSGLTDTPVL